MEYIEVITDAKTGFVTQRTLTEEEIAALAPTRDYQERSRQQAYKAEADPLFFLFQRGEATEQEWLTKIQEIKERYPYPA